MRSRRPLPVLAGESATVKVSIDAPFAQIEDFDLGSYVKGPDNVTFGAAKTATYTKDAFSFEASIPQGAASGTYEVIISG